MVSRGDRTPFRPPLPEAVPARKLPPLLRGFFLALILLTAVSSGSELYWHFALGRGYPYDWPFVAPMSRFDDLIEWLPRFKSLHTAAFFSEQPPVVYPAPMSMLYGVFRLLGRAALPAYLCLAGLIAACGVALTVHELRRHGVRPATGIGVAAVLLGTSYPFWFVVYTANLELVVFLCLASGLLLLCHHRPTLAAACFALAGTLKWTPFLFFLLFLQRRHAKALAVGLLVAAGVILVSLWSVYPDIARSWRETQAGANLMVQRDGLHTLPFQLGFDHSLLALIKFLDPFLKPPALARLWKIYAPVTGIAVLALWFGRVRRLTLAERVLFLTTCMVLLPPVSYDYTLAELYLPGSLLFASILRSPGTLHNGARNSRTRNGGTPGRRRLQLLAACFAVVMTAQGYLLLGNAHRSAQVKAVALLGMLMISSVGLGLDNMSQRHSHFMQPGVEPHVL